MEKRKEGKAGGGKGKVEGSRVRKDGEEDGRWREREGGRRRRRRRGRRVCLRPSQHASG